MTFYYASPGLPVAMAMASGALFKGPCEHCGKDRVVGHHDDYFKQDVVRWVCYGCHRRIHIAIRKAGIVMVRPVSMNERIRRDRDWCSYAALRSKMKATPDAAERRIYRRRIAYLKKIKWCGLGWIPTPFRQPSSRLLPYTMDGKEYFTRGRRAKH